MAGAPTCPGARPRLDPAVILSYAPRVTLYELLGVDPIVDDTVGEWYCAGGDAASEGLDIVALGDAALVKRYIDE